MIISTFFLLSANLTNVHCFDTISNEFIKICYKFLCKKRERFGQNMCNKEGKEI